MMYGTDLYRRLAAETGTDPSWHEVGSLRLASSPERFEELRRQAGWAKTFGLPLELISAGEAQDRFPLMSTDGVLGAVWLPTDGWLDPSGLANALAAGARQRGAQIRPHTRVVAIGTDRGRVTGVTVEHARRTHRDRRRRRRQRRRHVRAGDRPDGRRHRADHPDGPPIPLHRADRGRPPRPAAAPRPRQPRLLPRGGRRPVHGRLRARPGAVGARRRPARLQRQAPGARHGRASSRSWRAPSGASRRWPTRASTGSSTAPRASRPTTSSSSANRRSAASSWRPASRRTGSPARAGSGARWRRWIVDGEPELDLWKMDIRRFGPAYRSQAYTLARSIENYATYYDIHYPNEERQAGRPLRTSPTYEILARPGRGLRREVRLGAPELVRVQRRRRRRGPPTARLGGDALVAGDRRRGAGHAAGGRPLRRDVVRQDRGRRAGRHGVPRADVRERRGPRRSVRSSTPSCSTAAAGSRPT